MLTGVAAASQHQLLYTPGFNETQQWHVATCATAFESYLLLWLGSKTFVPAAAPARTASGHLANQPSH